MLDQNINMEKLEELKRYSKQNKNKLYEQIISIFLKEVPERMKTLNDLVLLKDFKNIEQLSHKIRSSSLYLGADGLANLSFKLEASAKINKEKEMDFLIKAMETEYSNLKVILENEVN